MGNLNNKNTLRQNENALLPMLPIANQGLVFELSISWILGAYQHVAVGVLRNTFYTFRPIIILFAFGIVLKATFFAMGAPMFLSFYSVWMFEVFYGILQLILSFIFVSNYYNNLAFQGAGIRPVARLLRHRAKQQCTKISKNIQRQLQQLKK